MEKNKNITFNDIARYTNFSKTTISRYFNNPDSLTPKNQKIIADALEKLNYKENKVARILANGQTEFIGLIIPNLYLHYYSEMLNQILSTYEQFGYKFLLFVGNEQEETERRYIQELLAYKIEGLIILSHTIPSRELAALPIPVVTIEREDQFVSSVNTDNYMGAVQASSLLVRDHCDVLIHINSPIPEHRPAYGRIRGFLDVCEKNQIEHQVILRELGNSFETAQPQLRDIFLDLEARYSGKKKGIFISGDTYANTFLNLLFRRYRTLPDDYEIIGFDGSPISAEAIIPLSTVGQQIDQIALEAVRLLIEEIESGKNSTKKPAPITEPVHRVITPVLIRRETTS